MTTTACTKFAPDPHSHGHGQERSFRWFAHAFAYTPQGNPNGLYNIRESLSLDRTGQAYKGAGSFEIVNNGKVLFSADFRSTATRVAVEI